MSEYKRITTTSLQALARGETVCLVSVVRIRGSAPRHAGARMIVWPDGKTEGTIGGGTFEQRVIEDAIAAMSEGVPRFEKYVFDSAGGEDSVGLCGGSAEVHIDILRPDPTLLMIGAGHIAQPLADMAAMLDMRTVVVDDREDWANRSRFPKADEVHVVEYDPATEKLSKIPVTITPSTYVVIATWGYDLPALEQVISQEPAYIGLVASPTKAREFFTRLVAKGVAVETLRRVHTPVGLDLGAESPAELALSILAEVFAVQRGASCQPLKIVRGKKLDSFFAGLEAKVDEGS